MQEPQPTVLKLQPVEQILEQAAAEQTETVKITIATRIKNACVSVPGIALAATAVFFILLLMLQPQYIFKKGQDETEGKKINYWLVLGISFVGGLCVYGIPKLIAVS